jgi:membrane-bound lytic murein transglycosylase B
MIKYLFLIFIALASFFSATAQADKALLQNTDVQAFIQNLVLHDHFDRKELETVFLNVHPIPEVIHHMQHPAEAFPWDTYKNLFVTQQRATKGVAFAFTHQIQLNQAEKNYKVPAEIIVAILGVESNYGTHVMKYLVIDALSNLAFNYPSRKAFFTSELKSFLDLTRKYHLDIDAIYGSYAGAIGPAQFMPDSVLNYAVITQDDLNLNDAGNWIPSIANFFQKKGWNINQPIVTPIQCPDNIPSNIIPNSTKHFYTPQELRDAHISDDAEANAMYLEFTSRSGSQCWLGYHNFAVIMRYNTSPLYAMAVVQLSEKFASSFGDF